jgi:hypothetical protein
MELWGGRVPLVIAALTPASLVLVHDVSFLAAYGASYRAVLAATGHDGRWTSTVTIVLVVSALLGTVGGARLGWLWLRARSLDRDGGSGRISNVRGYVRVLARIWPWLALLTAALFVAQENLEAVARGVPLPGLEPLLARSSAPAPVILGLTTFAVAALGALLLWGHETLTARFAASPGTPRPAPAPPAVRPSTTPERAPASILSLHLGRRAPPAGFLA